MLKTLEEITATKKRLTIEIPADTIEKEIRGSLEKLKLRTSIPGFRTGKAPLELIERRFGKEVEGEVLERLIPQGYVDALREADITPVDSPVLEERSDFKRHGSLSITLTVEVMPRIGNLNYDGIQLKEIPVAVGDTDVESVLKRQQEERATYEPSQEQAAEGDLVVVDYAVPDHDLDERDQVVKVGSTAFPDELSREVAGKNRGDAFSVTMTFPEGHRIEKLAGKTVTMKVSLKDIKKVTMPPLDDELAKDAGFENLDALRKHLSDEILKAKQNEVAKIHKAEIVKTLIESHDFDLPESLVDNEAAMLLSNRRVGGGGEAETGQGGSESLEHEARQRAARNVKASLLIQAIGKSEGVVVGDGEVKGAIAALSQRLSVSPENLMKFYISRDGSLDGLRNSLFEDKVLDLILAKAVMVKGE